MRSHRFIQSCRNRLRWPLMAATVLAVGALALSGCGTSGNASTTGGSGSSNAAGGSTSSGSSSSWASVVAGADQEGSVTVYASNSDAQNALLAKEFEKAYPKIKVNVLRILTPAGEQRAQTEFQGHAAGADVILNTDLQWATAQAQVSGFSVPLVGPNDTSAAARSARIITNSDKTLLVTANPHGYAWNSNLVGQTFTLNDLTNPKYKGKIGLYDFCTSDPNTLEYYYEAQQYGGKSFLQGLANNKPQFYSDSAPMVQALSSGEIQVGIPIQYSVIGNATQVKLAYPAKSVASPYYATETGWATHPDAAQVYINWLVTADGQAQWAVYNKVSVLGNDVPGATLNLNQLVIVDTTKFTTQTIDNYRKTLEGMFNHQCPV